MFRAHNGESKSIPPLDRCRTSVGYPGRGGHQNLLSEFVSPEILFWRFKKKIRNELKMIDFESQVGRYNSRHDYRAHAERQLQRC